MTVYFPLFSFRRVATCGIALCALLGSTVLAGCGSGSHVKASTIRIWYSTDDPVERAWSQELARQYQSLHRNVTVNLRVYSFEDFNTKLQLALSAGDPPDLAYVTPRGPGIPVYVAAHRLRNLATAARQDGWANKLRPGLLASYNQPFRYFGAPAGGIMAVPTSLAAVGILYNVRLLHALHLGIPKSMSSFETALARAKRAGYTPLGMGNGDGWLGDDWYLTLVNATAPPTSLQAEQHLANSFNFGAKPYVAAAQTLQRWAKQGYFTTDFGGVDAQEGIDLFFRGKTLFQLVSSSENAQIAQDQKQTRVPVGVFPFPRSGGGSVMPQGGYLGWVVPTRSSNPTGAISFINSLLTPQTAALLQRNSVLPAQAHSSAPHSSSWQSQYFSALNSAKPGIYIDAAPISNLNATMEANVQLLLQGYEAPAFLVKSLQEVYASRGKHGGSTARIDGEF